MGMRARIKGRWEVFNENRRAVSEKPGEAATSLQANIYMHFSMGEDEDDNDAANDGFLDFLLAESDQCVIAEPMTPLPLPKDHDVTVPTHMILDPSLEASSFQLSHAPLERIMFGTKVVDIHTRPDLTTTLAEIIRQQLDSCPTVCLVMRRPGCPFCREDALELSHYQQQETPPFHLIGIVRDASDQQGIHEMFTQYFPGRPLYLDVGMETYRGLGNRAIPFRKFLELAEPTRRINEKKIQYSLQGWSYIIQGGVLIFDRSGTLRYVYRENYSDQLRIEDVQAAVRAVRH